MNTNSGFQPGETADWAAAYAVYLDQPSIEDILAAVALVAPLYVYELKTSGPQVLVMATNLLELTDLTSGDNLGGASNTAVMVEWGKTEPVPVAGIIDAAEQLTGVKVVAVDTASDLTLRIVVNGELAYQHADGLEGFARRLYYEAGRPATV